jgi:hypothetical protein
MPKIRNYNYKRDDSAKRAREQDENISGNKQSLKGK